MSEENCEICGQPAVVLWGPSRWPRGMWCCNRCITIAENQRWGRDIPVREEAVRVIRSNIQDFVLPVHREPMQDLFVYVCRNQDGLHLGTFKSEHLAKMSWLVTYKHTQHVAFVQESYERIKVMVNNGQFGVIDRVLVKTQVDHL